MGLETDFNRTFPILVNQDSSNGGEGGKQVELMDDADDEGSYPLANKSMERQILDLLIEADTRGLTGTVSPSFPSHSFLVTPLISK